MLSPYFWHLACKGTQMKSKGATVTKSNELITASYVLSVREQRLILAAISLIDSRKEMPSEIIVTADYYASIFHSKNPYRDMRDAAESLWEREISMKNEIETGSVRWLSEKWQSNSTNIGSGHVRIVFTPALAKYLSALKVRFSSYDIERVGRLTTIYSFRLFEMLIQFKTTGYLKISIDEFKQRLKLTSAYNKLAVLRTRVIDSAIEEINATTGMNVSYEVIFSGRKADSLEFKFQDAVKAKRHEVGEEVQPGEGEGADAESDSNINAAANREDADQAQTGVAQEELFPGKPDHDHHVTVEKAKEAYKSNIDQINALMGRVLVRHPKQDE